MTFEVAIERLRHVADVSARLAVTLPNGAPNLAAAGARIAEGLPALSGELLIDWPTLDANIRALGGDVSDLALTVGEDALCEAALAATWDAIPENATRDEVVALLDFAARPALRAGFTATRELISNAHWKRGTCPACGALPIVAELRPDKEGASRVLRCGRCTAAWSFPRLACPACGESDHDKLRYLHVDGELDHRRAECCTNCGFYVKAVARLDPIDGSALLSVDLDSIALDVLALDAGYTRQPGLTA